MLVEGGRNITHGFQTLSLPDFEIQIFAYFAEDLKLLIFFNLQNSKIILDQDWKWVILKTQICSNIKTIFFLEILHPSSFKVCPASIIC